MGRFGFGLVMGIVVLGLALGGLGLLFASTSVGRGGFQDLPALSGPVATTVTPRPTATPTPLRTVTPTPTATLVLTEITLLPPTATPMPFVPRPGVNTFFFSEMYKSVGPLGLVFSDKLAALNGRKVEITGYMAPPLKPALDFFILTRLPLALCPFCSSDADWPEDIVFIRMPEDRTVKATQQAITVTGTIHVGSYMDEATGFVSQVRIQADKVELEH